MFSPSIITIQETKHKKIGTTKLPGYQTFEKVRTNKGGGGLLTAVKEDLNPVLVSQGDEEIEIIVVEADLGKKKIRIVNGYGPQEDDDVQDIFNFWQEFENKVIQAVEDQCLILIELDANAKLGNEVIKNDPHKISNNGKLLMDIITRQNLVIANSLDICKGTITRERIFDNKTERSVIDYILICQELAKDILEVTIDEERVHVLSRIAKKKIVMSDHNILYSKFNISYTRKPRQIRKEFFNFKCEAGKKHFLEETSKTEKLSTCFETNKTFEEKADNFFKTLTGIFHKCFQKVRIRSGNNKIFGDQSLQDKIKLKKLLKIFLLNNIECNSARTLAQEKLNDIEESLEEETATVNANTVKEHIESMETVDGNFSNLGFWKLKRKLIPFFEEPVMAKKDKYGNIITAPEALKKLYVETYTERLRNRDMSPELMNIYFLKKELWECRNEEMKYKKTDAWNHKDLDVVIRSLKNNISRDPNGMVNEVFKHGFMGTDLKEALLNLFNGIKSNMFIPMFMTLSNITTIYKNKGSRMDMNNDRGIFILTVMKKMLDKLIYEDNYKEIDKNMSDCNIGARRKKNIKDHLLIIHGIINAVVKGDEECIDVQIYDIQKAFDALWLEDCLNDIFDNLPDENKNDKISLLYESNRTNMVAIKTAVGLTKRTNMPHIVQQGGINGPLLCSNSIDKIGKKCKERNEHLYTYKKTTKISPLAFIDDLSGIARCGMESVALNTFLTTQIELKKLKFHTADQQGKSKCVKLHIGGAKSGFCPELKVHGTKMPEVSSETYLGDILCSDGKNTKNIKNRISKGLGIIAQIMNILDEVNFGPHYFEIALLLRESMLINGTTTNAEIWYNFSQNEVQEFENLDKLYLRRILRVPKSTPTESFYLETGAIPVGVIIQSRRLNYLHRILTSDKSGMLYKFFLAQWNNPSKGDWTEQVKADLKEFGLSVDFDGIASKSKEAFKKVVKSRAKEIAFRKLSKIKNEHSKMSNLDYSELEIQNYLLREDLKIEQKRMLFKYRTRMAEYGENFRAGRAQVMCPLCNLHLDSQILGYKCPVVTTTIRVEGNYNEIYEENTTRETIETLERISKFRKEATLPLGAHVAHCSSLNFGAARS